MKELELIERQIEELGNLRMAFFMLNTIPKAELNENGDFTGFKYVFRTEDAEKQYNESTELLRYLITKKMKYIEEHRRMRYEILHGMQFIKSDPIIRITTT